MKRIHGAFVTLFLLFCIHSAEAGLARYTTGNRGDVNPTLSGPAYLLGGGSTDVDEALQWLIDQVRGCTSCDTKIDIVILRASGEDGYNDYLFAMKGVDSVESLVITDRKTANDSAVVETARNAEIIFFAGGDQCNYMKYFKGTKLQEAVKSVYARGGGIGGTSAGLAILGEYIYDSCKGSSQSEDALKNPYNKDITFSYDFFHFANLEKVITDQHFVARNRMGRTLAFLARQIQDGKTKEAWDVAVNEETSFVVDKNGMATVMGKGPVYVILANHAPERCVKGKPLTYSNYKFWKLMPGGTFDLKNRPTAGFYLRSVTDGVYSADPYSTQD